MNLPIKSQIDNAANKWNLQSNVKQRGMQQKQDKKLTKERGGRAGSGNSSIGSSHISNSNNNNNDNCTNKNNSSSVTSFVKEKNSSKENSLSPCQSCVNAQVLNMDCICSFR